MTNDLTPSEYLKHLSSISDSEFALKRYPDKGMILFEILLNDYEKLLARMTVYDYADLVARNKRISLSELGLFTSKMIQGNMTIREILHDAITIKPDLSSFFVQNENSKYKDKLGLYPMGIAGGRIEILDKNEQEIKYRLDDLAKLGISGIYRTYIKDERLDMIKDTLC